MSYRISVGRSAERSLKRSIPPERAERIRQAIGDLSRDPRPRNSSRKLRDREGYRLRVGDYRIVYRVDDEERVVTVMEVWHRQRDYR